MNSSFSNWSNWEFIGRKKGFPGDSLVKNPPANAGDGRDISLTPGSERSPGKGHGNPLQYSCLENSVDRGAWWATVRGVSKSQTHWTTGHSTAQIERKRERKRDSWGRGGRKKAEEGGLSPESYTLYKNQTKWDHTLKHKHEPIKILEKKNKHKWPGEILQDLGLWKEFLDLTPSNLFF